MLGLERFELGHANGASADHSRIIRLSYHRPDYVRLARRAYESWAEVEAEAVSGIVTITGGLDLWPADAAIPQSDYTESLAAEGVPFELLDAAEIGRRWPQWQLDDDVTGALAGPGRARGPVQGQCGASAPRGGTARPCALVSRSGPCATRAAATWRSSPTTRPIEPGASSWPPMPGPTTCSPRSGGACRSR